MGNFRTRTKWYIIDIMTIPRTLLFYDRQCIAKGQNVHNFYGRR